MSKKRERGGRTARLAQGQLWKLSHLYIQIVALGRRVIQYRMLSDLRESGARIKTSSVEVLWGYLQSRRARLVHGAAPE